MFTVYCHINKINGKKYVGITKQNPEIRWHSGNGYNNNAILAIRDKVLEMPDNNDEWEKDYVADLKLRGDCPLNVTIPYFDGANRVRIDTCTKLDTRVYGEIQYYKE